MPSPEASDNTAATASKGHTMIDTSVLPPEVASALKPFDHGGDGISVEDLQHAAEKWNASQGHHDGFPLSAFPEDLQGTLKAFDQDGDGTVVKSELAAAANLYAESKKANKRMAKIICVMGVVKLFLLAAIFGLVYVVVEMSKETKTGDDGVMTSKDGEKAVQVDTVESHASFWDLPRFPTNELAYMKQLSFYVDMKTMAPISGRAEATFKVTGSFKPEGGENKVVFTTAEGYLIQINRDSKTGTIDMGETLGKHAIFSDPASDNAGRRLAEASPTPMQTRRPLLFSKAELEKGTAEEQAQEGDRRLGFGGSLMTSGSFTMMPADAG